MECTYYLPTTSLGADADDTIAWATRQMIIDRWPNVDAVNENGRHDHAESCPDVDGPSGPFPRCTCHVGQIDAALESNEILDAAIDWLHEVDAER